MIMKIKDYHKFQHFSNRRPPWIKLYREIMDDYDLSVVSDRAFRILIWLWLLASEDELQEGNLPDLETIAFRLRLSKQHISNALQELDKWVIQDDDNMISDGYQDDTLETERETETKKREEKEKRKKFVKPTVKEVSDYGEEIGFKIDAQYFVDYYESNGWIVGKNKMKDWQATIRNWQRRDDSPQDPKKKTKPDYTRYEQEIAEQINSFKRLRDYVGAVLDKYKGIKGFDPSDVAIREWRKTHGAKNELS